MITGRYEDENTVFKNAGGIDIGSNYVYSAEQRRAGDVGQEAVTWFSDNRLYIFQSLERAKENSSDGVEVVFVYDLLAGELYRESLSVPENYRRIFPRLATRRACLLRI